MSPPVISQFEGISFVATIISPKDADVLRWIECLNRFNKFAF